MQLFIDFVREQWMLWTALAVVAAIYMLTEAYSKSRGPKLLSAGQLTALMNAENTCVFDMRAQSKFSEGHIIGASLMSESELSAEKFQKFQGKNLVLVCDNGLKSLAAARKLQTQGLASLCVLEGGMQAWRGAGMPAVKK